MRTSTFTLGKKEPEKEDPEKPKLEPVRRVTPVRLRAGSILGLEIDKQNNE